MTDLPIRSGSIPATLIPAFDLRHARPERPGRICSRRACAAGRAAYRCSSGSSLAKTSSTTPFGKEQIQVARRECQSRLRA